MSEIAPATALPRSTARRRLKLGDIIFTVIFVIVVLVLSITLIHQLSVTREVSAATKVTDAVIADIRQQNAQAARRMGDAAFQKHHSESELANLFTATKPYVKNSPTIVRKTVFRATSGTSVANIYKFTGNQSFYIRVTASHENGSWKLVGISGNPAETPLLQN